MKGVMACENGGDYVQVGDDGEDDKRSEVCTMVGGRGHAGIMQVEGDAEWVVRGRGENEKGSYGLGIFAPKRHRGIRS